MPRPKMYKQHVADGFEEDCDRLIQRCSVFQTLTYHTFCEMWKDMNLSALYNDRMYHAEVAELSEEVVEIAKRYMVAHTSNFEELVAGLFLVYALIKLQPYPEFAAVRFVPDDVPAIKRLELVARRDQRFDVLYILGSILIEGPSQFHIAQWERGLEQPLVKYFYEDQEGARPKGVFSRHAREFDLLSELDMLSRRYTEAKKDITGNQSVPSLSYTNPNLAKELESSLKKIVSGTSRDDVEICIPPNSEESTSANRSDAIQAIKSKAMMNSATTLRHLAGVQERNNQREMNKEIKNISDSTPKSNKLSPVKAEISFIKKAIEVHDISQDQSIDSQKDDCSNINLPLIDDTPGDNFVIRKEVNSKPPRTNVKVENCQKLLLKRVPAKKRVTRKKPKRKQYSSSSTSECSEDMEMLLQNKMASDDDIEFSDEENCTSDDEEQAFQNLTKDKDDKDVSYLSKDNNNSAITIDSFPILLKNQDGSEYIGIEIVDDENTKTERPRASNATNSLPDCTVVLNEDSRNLTEVTNENKITITDSEKSSLLYSNNNKGTDAQMSSTSSRQLNESKESSPSLVEHLGNYHQYAGHSNIEMSADNSDRVSVRKSNKSTKLKPYLLKKRRRHELKQPVLRSKFKKLGLLDIANFVSNTKK